MGTSTQSTHSTRPTRLEHVAAARGRVVDRRRAQPADDRVRAVDDAVRDVRRVRAAAARAGRRVGDLTENDRTRAVKDARWIEKPSLKRYSAATAVAPPRKSEAAHGTRTITARRKRHVVLTTTEDTTHDPKRARTLQRTVTRIPDGRGPRTRRRTRAHLELDVAERRDPLATLTARHDRAVDARPVVAVARVEEVEVAVEHDERRRVVARGGGGGGGVRRRQRRRPVARRPEAVIYMTTARRRGGLRVAPLRVDERLDRGQRLRGAPTVSDSSASGGESAVILARAATDEPPSQETRVTLALVFARHVTVLMQVTVSLVVSRQNP